MAVVTITASAWNVGPRARIGYNFLGGHMEAGNRTLSDILWLGRVPHSSVIVDYYLRGTSGETVSVFKLGIADGGASFAGTAGSESIFGTGSFSTGAVVVYRPMTGLPYRVSLSDTVNQRLGATIYMTVSSGTWTTCISFDYGFWYFLQGQTEN